MKLKKYSAVVLALAFMNSSNALAQVDLLQQKDSNAPIEITADNLIVKQTQEQAIFSGNVQAIQGQMHLQADTMTVHYKSKKENTNEGNTVSKIDVEGRVFLSTPKETARGEKGIYNVDKKNVTLEDSVVLTQGQNIVKGDRLYYDLVTGKSELFSKGMRLNQEAEGEGKGKNPAESERVKGLFVPGT